jgi:glutathione S-transferase kappa 1
MRALTYIKSAFPKDVYITAFGYLFHAFWTLHKVPNDEAMLREVLSEAPSDFHLDCFDTIPSSSSSSSGSGDEGKKLFTPDQVAQIITATSAPEVKDALKARVDEVLKRGAFGAPWLWATDAKGYSEPFFGSDRWHWVYDFLGVPHREKASL